MLALALPIAVCIDHRSSELLLAVASHMRTSVCCNMRCDLEWAGPYISCTNSNRMQRAAPLLRSKDVPLINGGTFKLEVLDPLALLTYRAEVDARFKSMLETAVARTPPSVAAPWNIIVAFDEYIPGSKLRLDNNRKAQVCSFSFVELGQAALSESSAWSVPLIVRSSMMNKCEGGWPRMLRDMLHDLLFSTNGLAVAGLPLTLRGSDVLVFGRLHGVLADGDGHRVAFDWRGQGSLTPCIKHHNVLRKDFRHEQNAASRFHSEATAKLSTSMIATRWLEAFWHIARLGARSCQRACSLVYGACVERACSLGLALVQFVHLFSELARSMCMTWASLLAIVCIRSASLLAQFVCFGRACSPSNLASVERACSLVVVAFTWRVTSRVCLEGL